MSPHSLPSVGSDAAGCCGLAVSGSAGQADALGDHEGLVILSAAPYGASDRVLVAVAPQCPRKPGGQVVWSVLGHSVSPGSPFFEHPPVLQAWGRHKMEQGGRGDAVRAPSTRWQAETSPLSALVPCQGKGSPCGWGAAGLGVPRTGCPAPVPQLSGRAVPAAWGRENKRFPALPPELGTAPNGKLVPLPLLCPSSAAPLREADDSFGGRQRSVALSGAELRPSKRARPGIAPPGTEGPSPRRLHQAGLLGLPW